MLRAREDAFTGIRQGYGEADGNQNSSICRPTGWDMYTGKVARIEVEVVFSIHNRIDCVSGLLPELYLYMEENFRLLAHGMNTRRLAHHSCLCKVLGRGYLPVSKKILGMMCYI